MDPVFSDANAKTRSSFSAHETSFVQEDGETDDSDNNEEDSREFKLMNKLRQLTKKIWIVHMRNTECLLKGLKGLHFEDSCFKRALEVTRIFC